MKILEKRGNKMSEKRGTEYIRKLGLEDGHNAVKTIATPFFEVSGDEEIVNIALRNASAYTKQYGKNFRLIVFVLKRDDTGYMLFNDNGGFNVAGLVELDAMKEFAELNKELADYMVFAEIGDNLYTIVTID